MCALMSLFIFYRFCKKNFTQKTALIATLLLAGDPSFIFAARFDWGPIAIQQILKLLILFITFKIYAYNSSTTLYSQIKIRYSIALGFLSGLMLWDKLNAIWFLAPIGIILIQKELTSPGKFMPKIKHGILSLIAAAIGATPLIVFIIKKPFFYRVSQDSFQHFERYLHLHSSTPNLYYLLINYSSKVGDKLATIHKTLSGQAIPEHILTVEIWGGLFPWLCYISFITMLVYITYHKQLINERIILLITLGILVFILITSHANGPHHILMLWPFPHLIAAFFLERAYRRFKFTTTLLLITIMVSNLLVIKQFHSGVVNNDFKAYWRNNRNSVLIKELVKSKTPAVSLDWGITLPVAFESQGKIPIRDLQPFYEPQCVKIQEILQTKTRLIRYDEKDTVFPTYYSKCQNELNNLKLEKVGQFVLYSPLN
jgi:4-amino-4-deoxy-L-arabinose transferase-like glycosyltransferase